MVQSLAENIRQSDAADRGLADSLPSSTRIDVYDFFSGCGGTSLGLLRAGMRPRVAVDFDPEAAKTYKRNFPSAAFFCEDVRRLGTEVLVPFVERQRRNPILISACAPCQPFSRQNRQKRKDDRRVTLLSEVHRFILRFRPELVLLENVLGLKEGVDGDRQPFQDLITLLDKLEYHHDCGVLRAADYGVPQNRPRLFLIASAFGPIKLPAPTHGGPDRPHPTVRDMIAGYPAIKAGETHPTIANHRSAALSPENLARITATSEGKGRSSWSAELCLPCHKDVKGYTDVYGRMWWDRQAPAMTTRCISLSNGRFGHPSQDRAISVREAAALQTFDDGFVFEGSLNGMARQIGNAVPVELAHAVGRVLEAHVSEHNGHIDG